MFRSSALFLLIDIQTSFRIVFIIKINSLIKSIIVYHLLCQFDDIFLCISVFLKHGIWYLDFKQCSHFLKINILHKSSLTSYQPLFALVAVGCSIRRFSWRRYPLAHIWQTNRLSCMYRFHYHCWRRFLLLFPSLKIPIFIFIKKSLRFFKRFQKAPV